MNMSSGHIHVADIVHHVHEWERLRGLMGEERDATEGELRAANSITVCSFIIFNPTFQYFNICHICDIFSTVAAQKALDFMFC